MMRVANDRAGFSLVEVVVAMLVLTVGLLGLAAGTGWVIRSTELARVETQRANALQAGVERLKSIPWDDLDAGNDEVGDYTLTWTPVQSDMRSTLVEIVIEGPGQLRGGGGFAQLRSDVVDTIFYRVVRP